MKLYRKPTIDDPVIMGHENVGIVAKAGAKWSKIHGLAEGDRIFVEHYVGCMHCEWCRLGEYRHCELTDWRTNPDARRYGYTSSDNPGRLWGGFSQYMYLPWNAVTHKVPDGVTAELAGLVTPLSNGIEWALNAGKVGYASTVLIQGPGQQGLSQVVASKQAGASLIVVTGTTRDATRLQLCKDLGADAVIDVQTGGRARAGSWSSPAARVWTSSSTARPARAPLPCCSASTRSSGARGSWSPRARRRRSPTSR